MIEINLLPPQYRAVEKTPRPVFFGLIAGIAVVGAALVFLVLGIQTTLSLKGVRDNLRSQKTALLEKERKFDADKRKIDESRQRIDTVLKIVESKVPWSIKLERLVKILPRDYWVERIEMERRADGSGGMKLLVNGSGTAEKKVSDLKKVLRSDMNFIDRFAGVQHARLDVRTSSAEFGRRKYLTFELVLPLEVAAAIPGGRPR